MRKKVILLCALLALTTAGCAPSPETTEAPASSPIEDDEALHLALGEAYARGQSDPDETPAAVYHDHVITMAMVKQQRETQTILSQAAEPYSDREIVDDLLKSVIFREEAQARGLTVSEAEIDEFLAATVYATYETEEGRRSTDAYCKAAGLTFAEYVDGLRETVPNVILKAKLEEQLAKAYCRQHALPYDDLNPSQEVRLALQQEKDAIFAARQGEIQYFVDEK